MVVKHYARLDDYGGELKTFGDSKFMEPIAKIIFELDGPDDINIIDVMTEVNGNDGYIYFWMRRWKEVGHSIVHQVSTDLWELHIRVVELTA